jgi:hypothetical protein
MSEPGQAEDCGGSRLARRLRSSSASSADILRHTGSGSARDGPGPPYREEEARALR